MRRNELSDVAIFVAVAQEGGFRAAADRLGLGAGTVSEAVQRFEDRLGVRLLERTTRAIALTTAGETLYRRSLPAIRELESALGDVHSTETGLAGLLSITAPIGASRLFLDALNAAFAKRHPGLVIEVLYDEEKVDLVTGGADLAIRAETLLDPDTYAFAVGPVQQMALVASQDYLDQAPPIETPEDVAAHAGVCFAFDRSGTLAPWVFAGPDGPYSVMPTPRVIANDVGSIAASARSGLGLAYIYRHLVREHLQSGALVEVLKGQTEALPRFSLNYLSKRNMPARVRAYIDFAREQTW
ncbi:LysR family transcriptional regulator [Shimia sp. W99]